MNEALEAMNTNIIQFEGYMNELSPLIEAIVIRIPIGELSSDNRTILTDMKSKLNNIIKQPSSTMSYIEDILFEDLEGDDKSRYDTLCKRRQTIHNNIDELISKIDYHLNEETLSIFVNHQLRMIERYYSPQ